MKKNENEKNIKKTDKPKDKNLKNVISIKIGSMMKSMHAALKKAMRAMFKRR